MQHTTSKIKSPVIWVKTPKCAGTSLRTLLQQHDLIYTIESPEEITLEELKTWGNKQVLQIRHAKLYILEERFPEWFKTAWVCAIVRNPWDRFVSGWRYCTTTRWRFFQDVIQHPPTQIESPQDYHHITQPLIDSLTSQDGKMLCNHLIHIERLDTEVQPLFERIGLEHEALPKLNANNSECYRTFYNAKNWQQVARRFSDDVALLGYAHIQFEENRWREKCAQSKMNLYILWYRFLRSTFKQQENG